MWVLLALLPLWLGGMFGRGFWTPDEPREADIAWNMSQQADPAIPLMAGEPFLEKPPLLYWAAAPGIALLGPAPWVVRLPNLLFAALATFLIVVLGWQFAGVSAAWVAGLVSGSFLLGLQVAIWFATDAPLVAGTALALFGLWNGLNAAPGRDKLVRYLVMSAGLAVAFYAKNVSGWMVPLLALLTWVAWQRRWRELLRWELWLAGLALLAVIVPWVVAIAQGPRGRDNLLAFFWWNLAGRFTDVGAPAEIAYARDHANSFGKYFIEAPINLLPWGLLAIAAGRRAWQVLRHDTAGHYAGTQAAWQFAIASVVPGLMLLSFSSTARAVYAAPLLPGLALLLALWASGPLRSMDSVDRKLLSGTVLVTAALVAINLLLLPVLMRASELAQLPVLPTLALTVTGAILVLLLAWRAWRASSEFRLLPAIRWIYATFAVWLLVTGLVTVGWIDRAQNLAAIATSISRQLGDRALLLYRPDETTRSVLDMYLPASQRASMTYTRDPAQLAEALRGAPDLMVVIKLPDYTRGPVRGALAEFGVRERTGRLGAEAADLLATHHLHPAGEHGAPDGRRYLLLQRARTP
jgi:4-amino-4-deoxy-L-arabinose transferase